MKKLILAVAMPALLAGCTDGLKTENSGIKGGYGVFWTHSAPLIRIRSMDNQPIAGAQILIGNELNDPFTGNFITTDANGDVAIPENWTTLQTVTIQAPGFMRSTYLNQEPGSITFRLRPLTTKTQNEVSGTTPGLPVVDKDGWVDFGLVMPAFTRFDLLAFDINKVISPQKDRISTMGQDIDVPANIALPHQREKYSLFTITLDKPNYRIYFGQTGVSRIFAGRGRFPFKSTVDALRNGSEFYELINDIQITSGAVRDIEIKSGPTKLEMPTAELKFTKPQTVVAPSFRSDEVFMAVGLAQQSGYLIPTDVKKSSSGGKIALNTSAASEQFVLGVLKKAADMKVDGDRMSTALLRLETGATPKLLPLIPDPKIAGDELIMPQFSTIEGVNPIATYSVLSKEEEVLQGGAKVKILVPQWEVYAQNWLGRMKLPKFPGAQPIPGKKRWEVNFVGSQTASQAPMGPAMIEAATHVTHSSVTF